MLVHDRPRVHGDGFGGWRAVGPNAVWSLGVVMFPPLFDQDMRPAQRVEDLTIEQLISKPCIEALAISVLPGRPLLNIGGLGPQRLQSNLGRPEK